MQTLSAFKALADETRLRLMAVLLEQELNVGELVALFGMGQSRISRHLKILAEAGLLRSRRDGLWVFYSAASVGQGRALLDAVKGLLAQDPAFDAQRSAALALVRERAAATKRFFDSIAGDWETLRSNILGELDLAKEVASRMPACAVALDLGCGTGDLLEALLAKAENVIGVDASAKMLELARKRFARRAETVSLRIGELEHLPVRDAEAGFAVACMSLHHLSAPGAAVAEAGRALASGGIFLAADFEKHDNERMREAYGDRWLGFSSEEMNGWIEAAGLRPLEDARFAVNQGLTVRVALAEKP